MSLFECAIINDLLVLFGDRLFDLKVSIFSQLCDVLEEEEILFTRVRSLLPTNVLGVNRVELWGKKANPLPMLSEEVDGSMEKSNTGFFRVQMFV